MEMASLVSYSSSDESDNDPVSSNKEQSNIETGTPSGVRTKEPLPLPENIRQLFGDREIPSVKCDVKKHGGRVRSFPHEEGNWATHVYIPYDPEMIFSRLQEELILCLRPFEFHPMNEFHLSLSRTVSIRHHWIQEMTETLGKKLSQMKGSGIEAFRVKVYTNDEKTRSFLALEVDDYDDMLGQYVTAVDTTFEEYNLPKFYQPASFHISIAWCLGDVTESITEAMKTKLNTELDPWVTEHEFYYDVKKIECKIGNKQFSFPLATYELNNHFLTGSH